MNTIDHYAEKDASYGIRREATGLVGHDYSYRGGRVIRLVALRDIKGPTPIREGEVVTLLSTSNAGFSGITCYVELDTADGPVRRVAGSLGAFRVA